MKDELIIAAYGSHNASVAMFYKGQYTVIEVERWLSKKNAGLVNYLPAGYPQIVFDEIADFLLAQTNRSDVDLYLTNYNDLSKIKPKFSFKTHRAFDHHEAHAATSFYQSPYDEAITFTFDGGGDRGFFNVYKTTRRNGVQLLERFNQDLGFAYMILADHLTDIRRDPLNIGNLVYAGKLMGLCSYGNVREEWLEAFDEFYETFNYFGDSYIGGAEAAVDAVPKLMKAIGVEDFTRNTRFEGQFAWDIAATTQRAFERQFYKFAQPYFDEYPDMPITMSGGCALNVILNSKLLHERDGKVFVPPNTNDCGVAVGGLLLHLKPENQVDLTYAGTPVLDAHMFSSYIENDALSVVENISTVDLAKFIKLGNIVGVINGNSEHGPRALGNRSIICNPIGDMKDVLNKKVKDREWYRPFAPLVRLEDATTYFDFPANAQSRHMTYVAEVLDEWKEVIPAVTHEDGTGRIQTVTQQQNPFIYDLLTEFGKISDHGVLLNTSFNVNGKPILTRLSEAIELLKKTELDAVYYNKSLIFRRGEEDKYERNVVSENIEPLSDETTVYLLAVPSSAKELQMHYYPMIDRVRQHNNKIVLVCSDTYAENFREKYGTSIEIHVLTPNMMYYHELLQEKVMDIKMNLYSFHDYVRFLWLKPVMYKNYHRTKNHMFVSLKNFIDNPHAIKEVKTIRTLAKDDDKIIVRGGEYSGALTDEDAKRFSRFEQLPEEMPLFDVVWASFENFEWLSVQVEGLLLAHMREDRIMKDVDYAALLYMQQSDKFKVC